MDSVMISPFLSNVISADFRTGSVVASLFIFLLLGLAIGKCVQLMLRPSTSRLCVLSLVLVLASFFFSGALNLLKTIQPVTAGAGLILLVLIGLGMMLCLVAGLILSIVGLSLYGTVQPPFERGRGQGIAALVLSGLTLVAGLGAASYQSISESKTEVSDSAPFVVEETELNFRLAAPGKPWVQLDAKAHNPDATLMWRATGPERLVIVIAEKFGLDAGFSQAALTDLAKSTLLSKTGEMSIEDQPPREVNGLGFSVFRTEAKNYNNLAGSQRFEHWIASHNGFCYQLVFFSTGNDEAALAEMSESIVSGFSLVDPDLRIETLGNPVAPERQEGNGFSIDLSESGWSVYTDPDDYVEASFAAMKGSVMSTGITTFDLGELDPDIDALAAGCIESGFGIRHPDRTVKRREAIQGAGRGIELQFLEKRDAGTYRYLFRVLREGGRVWFLAAWGDDSVAEIGTSLAEALDAYELFAPVPRGEGADEVAERTRQVSKILNHIGLAYYRREDYFRGLDFYQEAFSRAPENGQYFENMIDSLTKRAESEKALEQLDEHQESFSENSNLDTYRGYNLSRLERYEESALAYAAAFERGHSNQSDLLDYVNVLVDLERQEDAIEVLVAYRERHPAPGSKLDRWEASLLVQLERYDEAIERLKRLRADSPADIWVARDLIESEVDAGRYTDALATVGDALAQNLKNGEILYQKGRAEMGLDSYRDAKASLEEALKLSPDDRRISGLLDRASAMLGRGNIALIKEPIEPVPLPSVAAAKAAELETAYADELDTGYGAISRRHVVGVQSKAGVPERRTSRTSVTITGNKGLDRYSTLRFQFNPMFESFHVNEVTVRDASGEVVAEGRVDDYYIVDETEDNLAHNEKVVHVPVPGLKIGHTLDYTVTRKDHAPSEGLEFTDFSLSANLPNVGRIVYLVGDAGDVRCETSQGVETLEMEEGLAFYSARPPIQHSEDSQPWPQSFIPWLWLNRSTADWETIGEEYLDRLRPRLEADEPALAEILSALGGETDSLDEKVFAIADYVSSTLSYQGIEFGPRAQMPNEVSEILGNRYGDCKDHSLLLKKLLDLAGIEAHLALVSTGAPVREGLPSLRQFDHMIVWVPGVRGSPFLDPTIDFFPAGYLAPEALLNERSLVLEPGEVRLREIIATETPRNRLNSVRTATLEEGPGPVLRVAETLTLEGYPAVWLRNFFQYNGAAEHSKRLSEILRHHGAPVIRSLEVKNLEEFRAPFIVTMSYDLPRNCSERGQNVEVRPASVWEQYFIERHSSGERHNPFEILIEIEFTSTCSIRRPEAWRLNDASLEGFSLQESGSHASWEMSASVVDRDSILLRSEFRRKTGEFPASDYHSFIGSVNRGLSSWNRAISFTVAPGGAE